MPSREYRKLRKKVIAVRKRKLRKSWEDADEDVMALATAGGDEKGK